MTSPLSPTPRRKPREAGAGGTWKRVAEARRRAIATLGGYFWLPCPVCGENFGGHEWRDYAGLPSSVPNPDSRGLSTGICPDCTAAGYGYDSEACYEIWEAAS